MQEDKIIIMGDVDCGKSSLLGRLLLAGKKEVDCRFQNIFSPDAKMTEKYSYAQMVDSLSEEISQQKTINTTNLRIVIDGKEYIFVDTPGHQELVDRLLNNLMFVSGAVIIVDISKGVTEYLKILLKILQLFRVEKIVIIINKLDLISFKQREKKFIKIKTIIKNLSNDFNLKIVDIIGISVKKGWNIFADNKSFEFCGPSLAEVLQKNFQRENKQRKGRYTGLIVQDVYEKKFLGKNKLVYVGKGIGDKFLIQGDKIKTVHLQSGKEIIVDKPIDIDGHSLNFLNDNEIISFTTQNKDGEVKQIETMRIGRGDILVVTENDSNISGLKCTPEIKIQVILPFINSIDCEKDGGDKIKKEINEIRSGRLQISIAGQDIWGTIQKVLSWDKQGDLVFFSCLIKLEEKIVWTPYFYRGATLGYGIVRVENLNTEGVFFCRDY
jgi:sulfate adenylyltransferase subunit 1 (EFTu-like GTPase family)